MNWEKIQYIFQIPISWYKKIHDRVFNAYGTNFIKVKEGYYGGMEIGLDQDELDNYLNQLSVVKSVDGIYPDISGNVELSAVTLTGDQTIYGTKTFASNVYLSSQPGLPDADSLALATVGHVNTFYARKSHDHGNLNNDGTITNVGSEITKDFYIAADSNGDLYKSDLSSILDGAVKSVNGVEPDENGNVTIDVGGGGISAVNGILPDATGNVVLGDIVHSVEGISPDQNGNVALTSMVKSVNNVFPVNGNVEISSVTMEDVEDYVEEQNFATEDYVTNQLTNYVDIGTLETTLEDYATQADIEGMVTEVDGILPLNGAIDFNLDANKWMKTDSNGHIGTTNEIPISLSATNHGYLYANNGSLEFKQEQYVTLSTEQTITAKKTFDADVKITNSDLIIQNALSSGLGALLNHSHLLLNSDTPYINLQKGNNISSDSYITIVNNSLDIKNPTATVIESPAIYLQNGTGIYDGEIGIYPTDGTIDIEPKNTSNTGGCIKFHYNHLPTTTKIEETTTSFNIDTSNDMLLKTATGKNITLSADANSVKLNVQPTDTSINSLAVATVGYCQTNFGKVKSVNNTYPDANGNVTITSGSGTVQSVDGITPDSATGNVQLNALTSINGIAGTNGNFSGVVTSVNGDAPTNGNVDIDAVFTVNETAPDANGNVDVGTVRAVDGHSPDNQGAVSFGLAANKWLKSDASGHITTTNDTVISVPSGTTPSTSNVEVVTGVTWNGTQIVVARKRLRFTNGIYTGATNLTNTTINTVAYT